MIEVGLQFDNPGVIDLVLSAFADLPAQWRPTHYRHEEAPASESDRIDNTERFARFVSENKSGFFLLGSGISCNLRIATGKPPLCECLVD